MNNTYVATEILCQQCTAVLPVETGSQMVVCQFCGTTNYVDKSQTLLHYAVQQTVRDDAAVSALRRCMAGNDTVKHLDQQAEIEQPIFEHFPMWLIRVKRDGKETVFMEPAAALSVSELKSLSIPAGDLEPYSGSIDGNVTDPTIPYTTMKKWLADEHNVKENEIHEVSLVHLPIYVCKYTFDNRRYTAVVDAATSKVFANIYPSKWEAPYVTLGVIAFIAYFIASLIPAVGYLFEGAEGMGIGVVIYIIAAIVLAIPIFVAASVISAKV